MQIFKRRNFIFIILAIILVFSIVSCKSSKANIYKIVKDTFSVHFLDVYDGRSVLLSFPNGENILVDTGSDSEKDLKTITEYLNCINVNKIDYLYITGVDVVHYGNALSIINEFSVSNVVLPSKEKVEGAISYNNFLEDLDKTNVSLSSAKALTTIEGKDYSICILSPYTLNHYQYTGVNISQSKELIKESLSLTMLVKYKDAKVLILSNGGKFLSSVLEKDLTSGIYSVAFNDKNLVRNVDLISLSSTWVLESYNKTLLSEYNPKCVVLPSGDRIDAKLSAQILENLQGNCKDTTLVSVKESSNLVYYYNKGLKIIK